MNMMSSDPMNMMNSDPMNMMNSDPMNMISSDPMNMMNSDPMNMISSDPMNMISSDPVNMISSDPMNMISSEQKRYFTDLDARTFSETVQNASMSFEAEQFDADRYLDNIIKKPWGHEYRVYADNFYDIWKLSLFVGQSTSMHCHPRKETALLCLAGTGKIQFLDETRLIQKLDFIYIGKGVFHSTENIGNTDLELVEVEIPRNKLDLVRFADNYGRKGKHYERKFLNLENTLRFGNIIKGSKLRSLCIHERYHFDLRGGMDIVCRPDQLLLFIVSLNVQDAINHRIQVFSRKNMQDMHIDQEKLHFTISAI
jgi:mannose-6-phosphate isomerase-like protein (cupin superfamily)